MHAISWSIQETTESSTTNLPPTTMLAALFRNETKSESQEEQSYDVHRIGFLRRENSPVF